jgi:signal transduction histidine kinase/CHASE2 domain-containing sensor protein
LIARRSWLACFVASGLLAALGLLLQGPLEVFELETLDLRFRLRERWQGSPRPDVVRTVLLDDASLAVLSHWPLPYAAYAAALDRLGRSGARVVGLDVLLAPADSSRPREARDYQRLAAELGRIPGAVLAVHPPLSRAEEPRPPYRVAPVDERAAYPWPLEWREVVPSRVLRPADLPSLELGRAAARLGFVQLPRDGDGVVRRVPLLLRDRDRVYPSFPLQVACEYAGVRPSEVRVVPGAWLELWREGACLRRIPVDGDGCMLIDYRRARPADRDLALADVAQHPGAALPGVPGRIVLVGQTARAVGQFHSTPLDRRVADVHVLAEAIETMIAGRFLQPIGRGGQLVLSWLFLLAGALLMSRLRPWRGVAAGIGLMALYFLVEKIAFVWGGRVLDVMGPMAMMQAAVVVFPLASYRTRSQRLLEDMARLRRFDDRILSTMTSGLLVIDDAGCIVKANARAARLLGRGDECVVGKPWRDLFAASPTAVSTIERAMEPVEAAGPACGLPRHVPVILESDAPEGDRLLDLSVAGLDPAEGDRPAGGGRRWLLTFTDITERLRIAQEDERRARLAAIGEIAAKLGHELRNSLGGLRLYVENVREDIDPKSPAGHAIDRMVDEIEGLYRKIDELREYARDPMLDLNECNLKHVVEDALGFAGRKLRDKGIQVTIESQPQLPAVRIDRRQIRDAIQNLIHNAIEAAPPGGHLRIVLEPPASTNGAAPAGYFLVHIEDDGPGVPAELGDQIFSLFFTTKSETGTGLGLSIVKKIVESHGGRVSYTSVPGNTRFTVALPAARREEAST